MSVNIIRWIPVNQTHWYQWKRFLTNYSVYVYPWYFSRSKLGRITPSWALLNSPKVVHWGLELHSCMNVRQKKLWVSTLGWHQWAFVCAHSCVLIFVPGSTNELAHSPPSSVIMHVCLYLGSPRSSITPTDSDWNEWTTHHHHPHP